MQIPGSRLGRGSVWSKASMKNDSRGQTSRNVALSLFLEKIPWKKGEKRRSTPAGLSKRSFNCLLTLSYCFKKILKMSSDLPRTRVKHNERHCKRNTIQKNCITPKTNCTAPKTRHDPKYIQQNTTHNISNWLLELYTINLPATSYINRAVVNQSFW